MPPPVDMNSAPDHIRAFWSDFLTETGRVEAPVYEIFHLSDRESVARELADLVLRGEKVAMASLVWEYDSPGGRAPQKGDLSVLTDWHGRPLCVIETTDVQVHAFEEADEDFAAAEGEGDLSLRFWREAHWSYFGRVCARLGREPSMQMPVVYERFRVIYPGSSLPA